MSTPNKPTETQPIEVPAFVARAAQRFSVEHDKPSFEILARAVQPSLEKATFYKDVPVGDIEVEASCAGPNDGDETAASPEDIAAAHEIFDRLPHREQCVVRARGEGQSWEEIAADEGVSVARVRAIHARAVRRIREEG